MEYVKIIERQTYNYIQDMNVDHLNKEERNALLADGWSELKYKNTPFEVEEPYYYLDRIITQEDDVFWCEYIKSLDKGKCEQEIITLKQQLADTDYKVVKNVEAQSCGLEPPYNPIELHNERQALRDRINELEQLLKGE